LDKWFPAFRRFAFPSSPTVSSPIRFGLLTLGDEDNTILRKLIHSPKEIVSYPGRPEPRNITGILQIHYPYFIHFNIISKRKDELVPLHDIRA
jgi:hypothetical protein